MTEPATQPPPAQASAGGWWATVREALRGSRHDYTSGPLGRAIVLLAIPMVAEMIMESVFAVWDVYWVGRVGPAAQATVGLTESLLTLIYTAAMGLSIGVTAIVARRIGEKNTEEAAEAAVQGIALGVIVAAVTGVIGGMFAPRLLALMGASPEVLTIGSTYARIMLGGNVVILLLFLINAVFRGAGDAAIAMRVLWLANSINIVLGPCLILGLGPFPRLGVTGAAIATTIGRGTGVLYQLYRLWRGDGRVAIQRPHLMLKPAVMRTMLRLSGTGTFQVLIGTASWIFLVRIISSFGTDAVAGYQIAIRIVVFALLPSWGLANAAATLVGQGLGAGNPDRAERAVWLAGFYQRGGDARGAGTGRGQPGPRRTRRVARGILQHGVPGRRGRPVRGVRRADRERVHARPRSGRDRRAVPADDQLWVPVLCVRDGDHAVVQRRGRHVDSHVDQPGVLLAVGDSAGVRAGGA